MELFIIILVCILLFFIGSFISEKVTLNRRKEKCKNWKVGDKIILEYCDLKKDLNKKGKEYGILKGWDLNYLYISDGDSTITRTTWETLNLNYSALWRENYENAKKVMGTNPSFPYEAIFPNEKEQNNIVYEGKSIDLMTETECIVFLKMALEREDFEIAELIKKRMEKFR